MTEAGVYRDTCNHDQQPGYTCNRNYSHRSRRIIDITTDNGTLQLTAAIAPTNATNQTVTWTIANGTGQATISSTGLVTAVSNGTVTARATANDGAGVYGTLVITISSQVIPVTGITVTGAGGSSIITTDNGTLSLVQR